MINIEHNLDIIRQAINKTALANGRDLQTINLVVVSKKVTKPNIEIAIKHRCSIFAENQLQEAVDKWSELKKIYPQIKLHFIGHLQTNKVKQAVRLFDVIQTLDSDKLAASLAVEMKRQQKFPQVLVQINLGGEKQKYGVSVQDTSRFIARVQQKYNLSVVGLMCIPPQYEDSTVYFNNLATIASEHNLQDLSMGMSSDYIAAIKCGATIIRLGSAIFGPRKN